MVYFLSDSHLGSRLNEQPQVLQQRFIDCIRSMSRDAEAVFFLGDIFDFWCEFYYGRAGKPHGYDEVLDALRELTTHCPVHFFIGNHDLWTFGWLAQRTGMTVHYEPLDVTLHGKRCFLAHGDGLVRTDRKYTFLRGLFHNPVAQFLFRLVPPAWGNRLGYAWAAASRRKHMQEPNIYRGENVEEQMVFAKQNEQTDHYDYYIFGHRHLEMQLLLSGGAQVCVIGDFCDHQQYASIDDEGRFAFLTFNENENENENEN
mgnify:CR=1 FL=1